MSHKGQWNGPAETEWNGADGIGGDGNGPDRLYRTGKEWRGAEWTGLEWLKWIGKEQTGKERNGPDWPDWNEKTFADMAKIISTGAFNPGVIRETAANLAIKTAAVNATNKWPGKQVWDTTNNRVVFSSGRLNTSVWKDGVNSTVYTPV